MSRKHLAFLAALITAGCGEPSAQTDAPADSPGGSTPVVAVQAGEGIRIEPRSGYVAAGSCDECHAAQAAAWRGSHHDRAMEEASAETVLGRFDGEAIAVGSERFRPLREADGFRVEVSREGETSLLPVSHSFGVEPLQQYLVPGPRGRLQVLPIAWDSRAAAEGGQRWFAPGTETEAPPGDPFHWTGIYATWNHQCAACHSTALEKRYDVAADAYATRAAELDVGCQACHGPGAAHVEQLRSGAGAAIDYRTPGELDSCAPCHSRRHAVSADGHPGEAFLDHFSPALLTSGLYHADGQILDEVYVYGSFLQSRMAAAGVRCGDCHDPHGLGLQRESNALCTSCHAPEADSRFPAAHGSYDAPSHHFHPPESEAAACVSCHMTARTYMGVDERRDHSFRLPRPDLAAATGAPDACTGCHEERGAEWAAAEVAKRFGAKRRRDPHYGQVLARGRRALPDAAPELAALARDEGTPAIVRATAVDLLVAYGAAAQAPVETAAKDPDPLVRMAAARASEALPPPVRLPALGPLLTDPLRSVRDAAAHAGSVVPAEDWPAPFDVDARSAFDEHLAALRAHRDGPEARINLAVLAARRGDVAAAERDYRAALRIAPGFAPAAANLSVLLNQSGRNAEALQVLDEAIQWTPGAGELLYSRGLLRAELGELAAAAEDLERAVALLPGRPRVLYNLGLAQSQLGRRGPAEDALLRARNLAPADPTILYALATFYAGQGEFERALPWAEALVEQVGNDPTATQLLSRIHQELSGR